MRNVVIKTDGLGKAFPLEQNSKATRITEGLVDVFRAATQRRASPEVFWALQDTSIEIEQGEVVALVGLNGAGKSTLLKLLSRILRPTTGRIELHGRVGSLLEVGTGFHPELTGRENIFLNGAVLGMTRREIQRKFDEIVAFAGVEQFLDQPVKRYSSGMSVRLAFAVAAHLEPEILLVDEVLAVGDISFQRKCLGRLHDLSNQFGRTVILVSHNPAALASLCHRGILLEHGRVTYDGDIQDTLLRYQQDAGNDGTTWEGPKGNDVLQLVRASIEPRSPESWDTGNDLDVRATLDVLKPVDGLVFGFRLLSEYGAELAYTLYDDQETGLAPTLHPCRMQHTWRIPRNMLASGRYRIAFEVGLAYKQLIHQQPFGELSFELQNLSGIARRYPVQGKRGFDSLFRPAWSSECRIEALPTQ